MNTLKIKFFDPSENVEQLAKKERTRQLPLGQISDLGRLVFPPKAIEQAGIDTSVKYKIGTDEGKRKIKSLYLVQTSEEPAFEFTRRGRGLGIDLPVILEKGGINYSSGEHTFTIESFTYGNSNGYILNIVHTGVKAEKLAYTGKPRGRKPKAPETPIN
jgi:hypothetical protein